MKRSELINLLLSKLHHLDLGTDDSMIAESEFKLAEYSDASQILEFLEELGMAPPEVAEQVKTSVMVATPMGWQEQVVEDSKVFVRKWEPEDA